MRHSLFDGRDIVSVEAVVQAPGRELVLVRNNPGSSRRLSLDAASGSAVERSLGSCPAVSWAASYQASLRCLPPAQPATRRFITTTMHTKPELPDDRVRLRGRVRAPEPRTVPDDFQDGSIRTRRRPSSSRRSRAPTGTRSVPPAPRQEARGAREPDRELHRDAGRGPDIPLRVSRGRTATTSLTDGMGRSWACKRLSGAENDPTNARDPSLGSYSSLSAGKDPRSVAYRSVGSFSVPGRNARPGRPT